MARDISGLPKFGSQVASDYVPPVYDEDTVFIRNFKEPMTLIRICPYEGTNEAGKPVYGPDAWEWEWEHYVDGLGSFPCAKRHGVDCPGCSDPDEEVRKGRRQYYFNALDEEGTLRVYKIGYDLWKMLQGRHDRAMARNHKDTQSLSSRDYMINRIKTGPMRWDVKYDPEPGDPYDVDWPEELHDIQTILAEQFAAALEHYAGEEEPEEKPAAVKKAAAAPKRSWAKEATEAADEEAEEEADEAPAPRRIGAAKSAAKKAAPAKKAAAKRAAPEPEEEESDEPDYGPLGATPSEDDLDDATTDELKQFLTGRQAEFPARAARSRLLEIATEVAAEPPF